MKTVLFEKVNFISQSNVILIYSTYVTVTLQCLDLYVKTGITAEEFINCIEYILKCDATIEIYSEVNYFDVLKENYKKLDLLSPLLQVISDNSSAMNPDRIKELYHLFFGLIYSREKPQFSEAEILHLLNIDIRIVNLIFKGDFDNAQALLQNALETIT
jgi:hypothetical protein